MPSNATDQWFVPFWRDWLLHQCARGGVSARYSFDAERPGTFGPAAFGTRHPEIGLWLNEAVLVDPAVESLREDLDRLGVVVRGCNGFPQTSFHAPVVKRSVYRPHWGQFERLQYTKRLAEVLVKIGHGPVREISTVPIGHRELGAEMLPTAVSHLRALVDFLSAA